MLKLSILFAVGSFAVMAPTMAQAQQGTASQNRAMIATDEQRARQARYYDIQREAGAERRSEERQERADRLSAMANNGQCRQAVVIARREGDIEMARSLVRHCGLPARLD